MFSSLDSYCGVRSESLLASFWDVGAAVNGYVPVSSKEPGGVGTETFPVQDSGGSSFLLYPHAFFLV